MMLRVNVGGEIPRFNDGIYGVFASNLIDENASASSVKSCIFLTLALRPRHRLIDDLHHNTLRQILNLAQTCRRNDGRFRHRDGHVRIRTVATIFLFALITFRVTFVLFQFRRDQGKRVDGKVKLLKIHFKSRPRRQALYSADVLRRLSSAPTQRKQP